MLNTKTFNYLFAIALICMLALVYLWYKAEDKNNPSSKRILLQDLDIKKITKLVVRDNSRKYTFYKDNLAWKILEKQGYPVLNQRIEEILYSLADLEIIEPKTANSEYYPILWVNQVTESNAKGIEVIALDEQGRTYADLIVGKRENSRVFVRRPEDVQAWLVKGFIDLSSDFRDWVEQPLLGLKDEEQIKKVDIYHKGKLVSIEKENVAAQDFKLTSKELKNGETLDIDTVNTLPYALAEIEYFDVLPAAGIDAKWDNALRVQIETFGDTKLQIELIRNMEHILVRVDTRPEWNYRVGEHAYALLAVDNEDFIIPNPNA